MGAKCCKIKSQLFLKNPKIILDYQGLQFKIFQIPLTFQQLELKAYLLMDSSLPQFSTYEYLSFSCLRSLNDVSTVSIRNDKDYQSAVKHMRAKELYIVITVNSYETVFQVPEIEQSPEVARLSAEIRTLSRTKNLGKCLDLVRYFCRLAKNHQLAESLPRSFFTIILLHIAIEAKGSMRNVSLSFVAHSPYILIDIDQLSPQCKKLIKKWQKMNNYLTDAIYEATLITKYYKRLAKFMRKEHKHGTESVVDKFTEVNELQDRLRGIDEDLSSVCSVLNTKASKRQIEKFFYLINEAALYSVEEIQRFFHISFLPSLFT